MNFGGWGDGKELGRKKHNQNILCERIYFQLKEILLKQLAKNSKEMQYNLQKRYNFIIYEKF